MPLDTIESVEYMDLETLTRVVNLIPKEPSIVSVRLVYPDYSGINEQIQKRHPGFEIDRLPRNFGFSGGDFRRFVDLGDFELANPTKRTIVELFSRQEEISRENKLYQDGLHNEKYHGAPHPQKPAAGLYFHAAYWFLEGGPDGVEVTLSEHEVEMRYTRRHRPAFARPIEEALGEKGIIYSEKVREPYNPSAGVID